VRRPRNSPWPAPAHTTCATLRQPPQEARGLRRAHAVSAGGASPPLAAVAASVPGARGLPQVGQVAPRPRRPPIPCARVASGPQRRRPLWPRARLLSTRAARGGPKPGLRCAPPAQRACWAARPWEAAGAPASHPPHPLAGALSPPRLPSPWWPSPAPHRRWRVGAAGHAWRRTRLGRSPSVRPAPPPWASGASRTPHLCVARVAPCRLVFCGAASKVRISPLRHPV